MTYFYLQGDLQFRWVFVEVFFLDRKNNASSSFASKSREKSVKLRALNGEPPGPEPKMQNSFSYARRTDVNLQKGLQFRAISC